MLSFLRKLSIGDKIRDGITEKAMAQDVANDKNQRLATADETELKESVYGEIIENNK